MINKLHFPRTSCNGAFAVVAIHWLSTMVSGWKNFRRSRIPLIVNHGFRMGKDFRSGRIRFFLPSPPHDFPCPFRIAIGLDTCLAALPTDRSLDSTSPARQTQGRLPASHSFRIATDSQPSAMASRRKDDRGTCVHFRVFRKSYYIIRHTEKRRKQREKLSRRCRRHKRVTER